MEGKNERKRKYERKEREINSRALDRTKNDKGVRVLRRTGRRTIWAFPRGDCCGGLEHSTRESNVTPDTPFLRATYTRMRVTNTNTDTNTSYRTVTRARY